MNYDRIDDSESSYEDRTAASVRGDAAAIASIAATLGRPVEEVAGMLSRVHGKTLVRNVFGEVLARAEGEAVEAVDNEGWLGVEEETDGEGIVRPYDPDKIRVDPKAFSLKQILDEIEAGDIDLAPDFQRNRVWSARQKVRLIESVLLRIPLPAFYFSADASGRLSVVDGVQRLSTIKAFVDEDFALTRKDLEYLEVRSLAEPPSATANECWYSELGPAWRRRLNQTQITANVIDPQTPEPVKFDIFRRINTGGSPLNGQEIRHSMMRERSRSFIKRLTETPAFLDAVPAVIHRHRRMTDREVVLRYLAFAMLGELTDYAPDSIDSFLMAAARQLDDESAVPDSRLEALSAEFQGAMENAALVFGDHAFRKWPTGKDRLFPFNKALFESWGYALRYAEREKLAAAKDAIVQRVRDAMSGREYNDSITVSTGDPRNVRFRFHLAAQIIRECI